MNGFRARAGTTVLPWLFILVMIGSLVLLLNRLNVQLRETRACQERLERIYQVLARYEREQGRLPSLEMFPEDPLNDAGSLLTALEPHGLEPHWGVCPSAPDTLARHGMTYLWNPALNHSSLTERPDITWVLVDLQALDAQVPGPHFGSYHILYSDGSVERSTTPPPSLPVQYE